MVNTLNEKIHKNQRFIISTLNKQLLKEALKDWLSLQAADFYDLGIQKLLEFSDKCLSKYGNYVENYRNMWGIK